MLFLHLCVTICNLESVLATSVCRYILVALIYEPHVFVT